LRFVRRLLFNQSVRSGSEGGVLRHVAGNYELSLFCASALQSVRLFVRSFVRLFVRHRSSFVVRRLLFVVVVRRRPSPSVAVVARRSSLSTANDGCHCHCHLVACHLHWFHGRDTNYYSSKDAVAAKGSMEASDDMA